MLAFRPQQHNIQLMILSAGFRLLARSLTVCLCSRLGSEIAYRCAIKNRTPNKTDTDTETRTRNKSVMKGKQNFMLRQERYLINNMAIFVVHDTPIDFFFSSFFSLSRFSPFMETTIVVYRTSIIQIKNFSVRPANNRNTTKWKKKIRFL